MINVGKNFIFVWILLGLLFFYVFSIQIGSAGIFATGNIVVEVILVLYLMRYRKSKQTWCVIYPNGMLIRNQYAIQTFMTLTHGTHAKKPTVAILGRKNSGKTTVAETVISKLRDEGYKVASVKHVFVKGFSLDAKNTDTYRHSKAGANPVISVSDVETAILIKDEASKFTLDRLRSWTPDADVLVLEGFSRHVLKDEDVAKIVCVRTMAEYEDFRSKTKGKILTFCSFEHLGKDILRIREDSSILEYRVSEFIREAYTKKHMYRSNG